MADYTDTEKTTFRDGAMGAMALVSKADSGFFAMFKESMAGSKALAAAPENIRELFKAGGLPTPKGSNAAEMEAAVLADLGSAMATLRAKDAADAEGYKSVLLAACDAVAQADDGVQPEEQAVIDKVRAALG